MVQIKLISFKLCPFVQRSVITLKEKNAPFEIEYIDLRNKPDWFKEISPLGKVPVLQTEGSILFESAVINEYIDETTGERLLPTKPLERAQHRMWIEFGSMLISDIWRAQSTHKQDEYDTALISLKDKCARLETIINGPLFFGTAFSLVDAAIAPALQRIAWSAQIDPNFDVFANNPKIAQWWETLNNRESVKKSLVPEARELFAEMINLLGGVLSKI